MNKNQFFMALRFKLSGLPISEVEESISFYSEIIDDKIEEGLTEKEAVLSVGSVDYVAEQILKSISLLKITTEKLKPKRSLKGLEIILLVVGSPIWFSLLISAFAVIFSLYASFIALIISVWAVFVSLIACGVAGILAGVFFIIRGNTLSGVAVESAGVLCLGLSIFLYYLSKLATKGIILVGKNLVLSVKKLFIKKEI